MSSEPPTQRERRRPRPPWQRLCRGKAKRGGCPDPPGPRQAGSSVLIGSLITDVFAELVAIRALSHLRIRCGDIDAQNWPITDAIRADERATIASLGGRRAPARAKLRQAAPLLGLVCLSRSAFSRKTSAFQASSLENGGVPCWSRATFILAVGHGDDTVIQVSISRRLDPRAAGFANARDLEANQNPLFGDQEPGPRRSLDPTTGRSCRLPSC